MSVVEMIRDEPMDFIPDLNGFHLEPRCRVCCNDQMRRQVNDMLACGLSYAMILRALDEHNAALNEQDRVTIDSIRNHTARHFPVQHVAKATYREILERRAKENGADFVAGVATAITPLAVLETVMVKGYQTLVDEGTTVSYRDGVAAALKLAGALRNEDPEIEMARMRAEMGRIIDVVKEFIPEQKWPALQARLRGESPARQQPESVDGIRVVHIEDPDEDGA